jgi:hypothetical protein
VHRISGPALSIRDPTLTRGVSHQSDGEGRAHYSATTLSDAAGGRRLPGLSVTLAYVAACDGDTTVWEQRWHAVAGELADIAVDEQSSSDDAEQAPYVGLTMFQPEDAERFFGRERLVTELADRVARQRLVMVVGPSVRGSRHCCGQV